MNQRDYLIGIQEWLNVGGTLKALELAEQAISSFPYAALFHYAASRLYTDLGNQEKALEAAESAVRYGHGNTEYRLHRAIIFLASNNAAAALADLKIILEDKPNNIVAKTLLLMCEIISLRKDFIGK